MLVILAPLRRGLLSRCYPRLTFLRCVLVNGTITHWLYVDASESLQLRMQRAAEVFLQPVSAAGVRKLRKIPDLRAPRRKRKRRVA